MMSLKIALNTGPHKNKNTKRTKISIVFFMFLDSQKADKTYFDTLHLFKSVFEEFIYVDINQHICFIGRFRISFPIRGLTKYYISIQKKIIMFRKEVLPG